MPDRKGSANTTSTNFSKSTRSSVASFAKKTSEQLYGYIIPHLKFQKKHKEAPEPLWEPQKFKRRTGYSVAAVDNVQKEELTTDDIIIAVMGPTGAGKSTFIQTSTGRKNGVGHTLESCTSEVAAVRVKFTDGVSVVLVDTPGFDDTYLSDLDVLKKIAKWLRDAHRGGLKLAGVLYLHRITDNRMAGTPLKNLTMFKKLCGKDFFEKVILTTTMWPKPSEDNGEVCIEEDRLSNNQEEIYVKREEELSRNYWGEMISRGALTQRFMNTQASAWDIIDHLIADESRRRLVRIQEELVEQRKKLSGTEAGKQLHGIFGELIERQNDLLGRIKSELEQAGDPQTMMALLGELSELRKEREKAMNDMRWLDSSLSGRLRRIPILIRRTIRRPGSMSQRYKGREALPSS